MTIDSVPFIDGELTPANSGKTYPNINPATEELLGQVADAGPADMERAIAAARHAFDQSDWSTNHAFRLKCLSQLRDALLEASPEVKAGVAAEIGSPMGICGGGGPQCDVPFPLWISALNPCRNLSRVGIWVTPSHWASLVVVA
jgi:aldehyde dehydrogenase (NAD+)